MPLNCWSEARKIKGNAVVASHFHMDHRLSEAPTRETNAAGYLIQMREGTPQSEPGGEGEEKGEVYQNATTSFRRRPFPHPVA